MRVKRRCTTDLIEAGNRPLGEHISTEHTLSIQEIEKMNKFYSLTRVGVIN